MEDNRWFYAVLLLIASGAVGFNQPSRLLAALGVFCLFGGVWLILRVAGDATAEREFNRKKK